MTLLNPNTNQTRGRPVCVERKVSEGHPQGLGAHLFESDD